MKIFFLYLIIIVNDGNYYLEKVPFGFTLRPITCDEAFSKAVTHKIPFTFYKGKVVGMHTCKDIYGNYYWGYEEQLNYDTK